MSIQDEYTEKVKGHFRPLLAAHGQSFKAVDWGSKEGQTLRFSVLVQLLEHARTVHNQEPLGTSILDVGCGLGHFRDYLDVLGFHGTYKGIDILPEMVSEAKRRHPNSKFDCYNLFQERTLPGSFDYVMASGIFFCGDEKGMHEAISILFENCNQGLAFNSLSAWCEEKDEGEFYACPVKTIEFCRTLTPWLALKHDYMPNDFTIFMYKEKNS